MISSVLFILDMLATTGLYVSPKNVSKSTEDGDCSVNIVNNLISENMYSIIAYQVSICARPNTEAKYYNFISGLFVNKDRIE